MQIEKSLTTRGEKNSSEYVYLCWINGKALELE